MVSGWPSVAEAPDVRLLVDDSLAILRASTTTEPAVYHKLPHNQPTPVDHADVIVQPKILGYRQLSQAEADLMNRVKVMAAEVGELVSAMRANETLDQRWVAIGATELQQGFMALGRAVAQPTTF